MRKSHSTIDKDIDDHIYYNVNIFNDSKTDDNIAYFAENRTVPILECASDYHLSVIRFSIPSDDIPIYNFPTDPLTITLRYAGADYKQALVYVPQNNTNDQGVYSYQQTLDMINTAFLAAYTALKVVSPAAPPTQAPYMIYDSTTQLFSLMCQALYYNATPTSTIQVYMNQALFAFFQSFQVFFNGYDQSNGKDYLFVIKDNGNNQVTLPTGGPSPIGGAGYQMRQESVTISLFNSIKSIVFTSGSVPVRNEMLSTTGSGENKFQPIMTDFNLTLLNASDLRSSIQYFPPGEYRLCEMTSNEQLRKFDITAYWSDKNGTLYPIYLSPNTSANIKIMFRKKGSKSY